MSDEEKVLTSRQSLQSIAVELHRSNEMAAAALILQQRQLDLTSNLLDFFRLQHNAGQQGSGQMMEAISSFLGPIGELLAHQTTAKPQIQTKVHEVKPAEPVSRDGDGTRVTQEVD